ncbi:MAG TPA: S41 family peptidase [Polyangiaceae bacterium]|nr:S41 family peptidase [Polyangiaceae bacterium]
MTNAERAEDLQQIFAYVRTFYGPYEYKEQRFGYSIPALEATARQMLARTGGDDGFYSAANWFLSRLRDGHVSLESPPDSNPIAQYIIPLFLQPVQGKALVAEIFEPSLLEEGIEYGDEVLSVDGISPFDQLGEYGKLHSFANDLSDQHLIYHALIRPGFAASLRPRAPTAHIQFRRSDGSEYARDLVWREDRSDPLPFALEQGPLPALHKDAFFIHGALARNALVHGSLASWGAPLPFFYTQATAAVFDVTPVGPNAQMLARYGLDPSSAPTDIFAALYSYQGKTILLVRQSGYAYDDPAEIDARLAYYRAILDQYDAFVDGLVLDQTHNPGGNIRYCIDFARLFLSEPGPNFVQAYNTDRTWINEFRAWARASDPTLASEESQNYELRGSLVEAAYDAGKSTTDPLALYRGNELRPDGSYVWTKPRVVLIDELSGSCGDIFPMLIQRNGAAPLFGRRTMGLGGNVEAVGALANSTALLHLTRGLFTSHRDDENYPPSAFIENNGIEPDIEHEISVDDFRNGFVEYMAHFSQVLAAQIDGTSAPTEPPPADPGASLDPAPLPEAP